MRSAAVNLVFLIIVIQLFMRTLIEKSSAIKEALHTPSKMGLQLRRRLELSSEGDHYGTDGTRTSNKDLDPVPLNSPQRTWGWPSLLGFWIAEAFSISMYQGE